jgi:hypothetical protein
MWRWSTGSRSIRPIRSILRALPSGGERHEVSNDIAEVSAGVIILLAKKPYAVAQIGDFLLPAAATVVYSGYRLAARRLN